MPRTSDSPPPDFLQGLLESYAVSERMNQLVLENLDPRARAKTPGRNGRTIAVIGSMEGIR